MGTKCSNTNLKKRHNIKYGHTIPAVMKTKVLAIVTLLLAVSVVCMVPSDDSDASLPSIEVKDGFGTEFTFDGPVDKVISIGVGVTATVIGIGALDKIVVCDSYSKTNSDTLFDPLRELIDEGKVAAGGNIYNSGKDQLWNDIVNAAEPSTGTFDREKDVVILTGSDQYRANIVPLLEEKGFRNVLQWYDIKSYEDLVDFAETISKVCMGNVVPEIDQMKYVKESITSTIASEGVDTAKAFYVTYSGGSFKVGNTGSIATSMILAAGGNAITVDSTQTATTYVANLTKIVEENPDVVIFVDNTVVKDAGLMAELRKNVGDDVTLVPLKPIWNNYCLESMDGIWTMATAMYPDLFEGDVPTIPSEESDTMLYVGAAVVVVAIIAAVAFLFMRKGN